MAISVIWIVIIAAILGLVAVSIFTYAIVRHGERIITRWYNAKIVREESELLKTLSSISEKSGVPCPKLYTFELPMPNLLSIGRGPNDASILVTTEALKILDTDELESVFAHEMFHIKNNDIRFATIAAALGGVLTASATLALVCAMLLGFGQKTDPGPRLIRLFAMSLSAPHAAFLIRFTKAGMREYIADEYSAMLCRKPEKIESALKKMEGIKLQMNPSHAHMFFTNPLNDEIFNSLFDNTPSIEKRVKNLKELSS
ncbi:MAG: M48 family metalloprotease [Candidatus Hydrothermarchaeaceae archaeon]